MNNKKGQVEQIFSFYDSFYRNLALTGVVTPYRGVPHLTGDLSGQWSSMQQENGILNTIMRASNLADKDSKGMCSFWVNDKLFLLIQKPSYVREFKDYYDSRYLERTVAYWNFFPGPSAIGSSCKLSLGVRKAYKDSLYNRQSLEELIPKINDICKKSISDLKQNESFNPNFYFRKLAIDLAIKLFMGLDDQNQINSDDVVNYLSRLLSDPSAALNLLGFQDKPTDSINTEKFKQEMEEQLKLLFLNKNGEKIKESNSLFNTLWQLGKQFNGDADFTVKNLFPDAFFFLAGGIALTLGDSLYSVVKFIATYPDVEKRLVKELEQIDKDFIDPITIDKLEYLDMVIKEVFRIAPPVPIIPARQAKNSFKFKSITVQKGDCVLISPYASHHCPSFWNDPAEFIPERFSKENKKNIPTGAYIPFSLGARNCIGERYAMKVLKMFIAMLFNEFHVKLINDSTKTKLDGPSLISAEDVQIKLILRRYQNTEELNYKIKNS